MQRQARCAVALVSLAALLVGCGSGSSRVGDASAGAGGGAGTGGNAGTGGSAGAGGGADAGRDTAAGADTAAPPAANCAALPAPGGTVVNVTPAQAGTLDELTLGAAAGTTFVLSPGTYAIVGSLRLEAANVGLRSSTDHAADVIIDATYTVAEAVVVRASNVTIAHVTITRAVDHAIL